MELHVQNSPFTQEQVELINRLLPLLTEGQQQWLSGYLTAYQTTAASAESAVALAESETSAKLANTHNTTKEVTVLFGSQTGNGQRLAERFSKKLEEKGFRVLLFAMSDFKPNTLKKVKNLLIIASTHGEGEPPDNALSFYQFLHSRRAPKLEDLRFAVLSLGDSSYEFFCQTGKQFDERLAELGGKRLCPRTDCDLDFDKPAAEWFEQVVRCLSEGLEDRANEQGYFLESAGARVLAGSAQETAYSRTNPFQAEVLENINLNGRGSNKETRHLELSLEGSNLHYEPGDSLGIYPENDPVLVDALIEALHWNPEELISINHEGQVRPLREALLQVYEITVLTKPLLEQAAELSSASGLRQLLDEEQELKAYLKGRDLLDLVRDYFPAGVPASEIIPILRKIPARLYSIASSIKANPDEVHLTIGAVRYHAHGRDRNGVCSVHCAERVQPGDTLSVFIQPNPNFKLPADSEIPIIMIGPGTGVAPFRSFLEEREETGANGKTWLFFGDRHYVTDFLYQVEWQRWLKEGVLTKLDLAFSRDTEEKVYVQHRMLEKSGEIYQWLKEGAYLYVCGDQKSMAADVHGALVTILQKEAGLAAEEAEARLIEWQKQKRYQRDVY